MMKLSRRAFLTSVSIGALAGSSNLAWLVTPALAQKAPEPGKGNRSFKVGDIEMAMLWDGSIDRANAPGFVRNASVAEVKGALEAARLPGNNIPNLFSVPLARIGDRNILFDAGTGGQLGAGTGLLMSNLQAAGRSASDIHQVLVSHFHPDHILGLMEKDTNAPVFANAEIVMPEAEYAWWTDAAVFTRLPEARHGLARRIQAVFPVWREKGRIKLVGNDAEVAPGIRSIAAPGHTPGHTAWHVASGKDQLLVLADTVTFDPVFLRHPDWQPAYDQDGKLAEASRHRLLERVIADKAMMAAYHFVYPAAGTIQKDGAGYAFLPVA